ncbi:MAG: hypothetical protein H0W83_07785, partial [Planctomycetes bacterium]|nr:hypothetical protein [Planctomycetota bacterium]
TYAVGTFTATLTVTDNLGATNARTVAITVIAPADTTAPVMSGIAASAITATSATISWTTNEAADSQVEYGSTTAYGNATTVSPALATAHSQDLSGLIAAHTYHYRVKSRDAAGNLATSGDSSFTTAAASGGPTAGGTTGTATTSGSGSGGTTTSGSTTTGGGSTTAGTGSSAGTTTGGGSTSGGTGPSGDAGGHSSSQCGVGSAVGLAVIALGLGLRRSPRSR